LHSETLNARSELVDLLEVQVAGTSALVTTPALRMALSVFESAALAGIASASDATSGAASIGINIR